MLNSTQNWSKQELHLTPTDTDHYGRLSLTSTQKGVFWIDQVSVMPSDTYKVSINIQAQRNLKKHKNLLSKPVMCVYDYVRIFQVNMSCVFSDHVRIYQVNMCVY